MRSIRLLVVGLLCLLLSNCATAKAPEADREPAGRGRLWSHNDEALRHGDLTVWKLKEMAENKQYDELNQLYNNGLSMDSLPLGYSAGAGARVLNLPGPLLTKLVDSITGDNWRGKIFFKSRNPRESHGLNRIKAMLGGGAETPVAAMAAFTTSLLDHHELVPQVRSNFVVLNYAHPKTKPWFQERLLTQIQVFDIMVAVPGKYGPIYIGKTWLGKYDDHDVFHANNPNALIAWYFLDFSQAAFDEQKANYWDGSNEPPTDYR